jgi:single-strand DNA-binding protein
MFNKVILAGRLTKNPESTSTPSGVLVTRFTLAVNRRFQKQGEEKKADFINIVSFNKTAEFVAKYFGKGKGIIVVGRLENREWQDKQGNKRISTEIIAEEVTFCDGAEKSEPTVSAPPKGNVPYMPSAYTSYPTDNFASSQVLEVPNTDDLPF